MIFNKVISKVIEKSDIILEVLDARFVDETRNEVLEERIKSEGKVLIYVINKVDLIDNPHIIKKIKGLKPAVPISCKERLSTDRLRAMIKRYAKKGERSRVGIIGYPNVGKSSLINILVGRARAKTSSQSGMTRGLQFIRLTEDITLLDSPGTFPTAGGDKLVLISSIDFTKVEEPMYYVELIQEKFPGVIEAHYNTEDLEVFGRMRGFIKKGAVLDEDRLARYILKDWQQGRIHV